MIGHIDVPLSHNKKFKSEQCGVAVKSQSLIVVFLIVVVYDLVVSLPQCIAAMVKMTPSLTPPFPSTFFPWESLIQFFIFENHQKINCRNTHTHSKTTLLNTSTHFHNFFFIITVIIVVCCDRNPYFCVFLFFVFKPSKSAAERHD